jgi:photosystem II stability/assembly factor-like uncharacterized protein
MRLIALLFVTSLLASPRSARAQWRSQPSGTEAELRGLSVVGRNVVWASGTRGRYIRTTDGGRTWRVDSVPDAGTLDFRTVHAIDSRVAVLVSAGDADKAQARIYRTADGGARWTLVYRTEEKGVFLDAVAFWDARHGIAMSDPVGGRFFLLTTSDGGRTWTRLSPDGIPAALAGEAAFAASGSCLTVQGSANVWIGTGGGAKARVYRSTDRGRTWSVAETPVHAGGASSGIFSVAFRDARHGIAVGGDYQQATASVPNVALTDDGGASWRLAKGPLPSAYLSAVTYVPNSALVVAVGLAGTALSSDRGESWTMIDSVSYNSVRFATGDAGWAAGPHGRIARWSGTSRKDGERQP